MDFSRPSDFTCFLVDNGSLQPAATRALRRIAGGLAASLARSVEPVSLLHSDKIPASELDAIPAEILEPAIRRRFAAGKRQFLIVPLFFGPSGALTEYIPRQIAAMGVILAGLEVAIAAPVAGRDATAPDRRLAQILAHQVRTCVQAQSLSRPLVVMVDHGSPQRAVAEVRDQVARQLAAELGSEARAVLAASMERREGPEYEFNEPLLERALAAPPGGAGAGDVVVAPLFFSAGRHAGPRGDIETIARKAESQHRGLRVHFAPLVGEHPRLIDLLADRYREAAIP